MAELIENINLIEAAVGRWKPTDVAFIREVLFSSTRETVARTVLDPSVELVVLIQPRPPQSAGWPNSEGVFWKARIRFDGVRDFSVRQYGSGDLQVEGFNIEDLSKSQMEGIRLRVFDYESDRVAFWAVSAQVLFCELCTLEPMASPYSREYQSEYPEVDAQKNWWEFWKKSH